MALKAFFVSSGFFESINDPDMRQAELPGAGGVASARALARMYAACLNRVDGIRLLQPESVEAAMVAQTAGLDRVVGYASQFGLGFQLPIPEFPLARAGSFGHYGFNSIVGLAHPERGLAFGYAKNQMTPGMMPGADPRNPGCYQPKVSS